MGSKPADSVGWDVVGYLGGGTLAICTLPQLWHMYRTRSADDLSWRFLALYLSGAFLTFAYLVHEDARAAWISMTLEITLTLTTLFFKLYLDYINHYRSSNSKRQQQQQQQPLPTADGNLSALPACDTAPAADPSKDPASALLLLNPPPGAHAAAAASGSPLAAVVVAGCYPTSHVGVAPGSTPTPEGGRGSDHGTRSPGYRPAGVVASARLELGPLAAPAAGEG